MTGMFSTATALKPTAKTAKAKKERVQVAIAGMQDIAVLDAMIKAATAMKTTLEANVKADGFTRLYNTAIETGAKPESFEALDRDSMASVQLRKRGTNSALNDDEVAALQSVGVEPHIEVVTPGLFAINPEHASNSKLLEQVEKALSKIAGLPANFIVQQAEVTKKVVSEEMLLEAIRTKKSAAVVEIMTTMALKPTLTDGYAMANLMADAAEIMFPKAKTKVASKTKAA